MKVIFLDFDGVLNSKKYINTCKEYGVIIDSSKMVLLKQIIDSTDARIVLSTSWREHWSVLPENCDDTGLFINDIFKKHGILIFDKTPERDSGREEEIIAWLHTHPQVKKFVVLDDMLLSADLLEGHIIKTSDYFGGLDETDVRKATEILNT